MSSQAEENKALVLRFLEARVKPDLDALDKMLAPDFVSHTKVLPGQPPDREGYKWSVAEFSAAFSDIRFIIEEQVAEGDKVVRSKEALVSHYTALVPQELTELSPEEKNQIYKIMRLHVLAQRDGTLTADWGCIVWPLPRSVYLTLRGGKTGESSATYGICYIANAGVVRGGQLWRGGGERL